MDKQEFFKLYQTVRVNLFWKDASNSVKKAVEKQKKIKMLNENDLNEAINKLKSFDINLLWDKSFWKLSVSDSISAVASEPYNFLKRLRNNGIK